jgi:hypothetical protein
MTILQCLLHPGSTRSIHLDLHSRIHTHELIYPPTAIRHEFNDHELILTHDLTHY